MREESAARMQEIRSGLQALTARMEAIETRHREHRRRIISGLPSLEFALPAEKDPLSEEPV